MQTIRVDYHRKVGTNNYGSTAIGGSLEFKPASDDAQKEFDQAFLHLKLIVDAKIEEEVGRSGGTFDEPVNNEPDLGEEPNWVGKNPERTAELLGHGTVPPPPPSAPTPPPPPPPAPIPAPAQEAGEDLARVPVEPPSSNAAGKSTGGNPDGREVYLERAKVFRVEIKRSKTGKAYAELRIGHEDLEAHINDKYVTTRIFVPEYVSVVGSLKRMKDEETGEIKDIQSLNIKEHDFVNLWGTLSAWTSNPTKYDLTATAIQVPQ